MPSPSQDKPCNEDYCIDMVLGACLKTDVVFLPSPRVENHSASYELYLLFALVEVLLITMSQACSFLVVTSIVFLFARTVRFT